MKSDKPKVTVIAGAGPAGLTAALELLRCNADTVPVIFEQSDMVGGISRTVRHHGNRIDLGGHRFFSKSSKVTDFWESILPLNQDPETTDRAMMRCPRVSRIYYLRRFFDYPVSMSLQTIRNLGVGRTLTAGISYLKSAIRKRPESSLEDFYINRFGKKLYTMFFEDYTEKVWGMHPSRLGADWGSQRVKGLSLRGVLKDMLLKGIGIKGRGNGKKVETSLIEEFIYPKYGPGQLWEAAADEIRKSGGDVELQRKVHKIHIDGGRIVGVTIEDASGHRFERKCDYFVSSMPIKELIGSLDGIEIPLAVKEAAKALPYRDFITVGLLVDQLKIKNQTATPTYLDRIPDNWIYIQERDVKLGRIQVFNNWSPYMVADSANRMWIGLEYFCNEGDQLWAMTDDDFIRMAITELEKIGFVDAKDVRDSVRIKVKKAYPAYFGSYYDLPRIREFLDSIPNLYCIGRNGQHRYNNMDHSMLTAMEASALIDKSIRDTKPTLPGEKTSLWNVNTEGDYHES